MKVAPSSVVVVSQGQMASDIGGETVILAVDAGRYYGLDAVGARIWQLIQEPREVSEICRTMVAEYAVDAERCEADVLHLLEQLSAAGLVEVRSASAP